MCDQLKNINNSTHKNYLQKDCFKFFYTQQAIKKELRPRHSNYKNPHIYRYIKKQRFYDLRVGAGNDFNSYPPHS